MNRISQVALTLMAAGAATVGGAGAIYSATGVLPFADPASSVVMADAPQISGSSLDATAQSIVDQLAQTGSKSSLTPASIARVASSNSNAKVVQAKRTSVHAKTGASGASRQATSVAKVSKKTHATTGASGARSAGEHEREGSDD